MNRFSVTEGHKFGNLPYDSTRDLNIHRLVSQTIEHNPIIKTDVCDELMVNPYSHYHLHCLFHKCTKILKENQKEAEEVECVCHHEEEPHEEEDNHHITIEEIYMDSNIVHKFDIYEERNKMRNELERSRTKQKLSIKDFLKKP